MPDTVKDLKHGSKHKLKAFNGLKHGFTVLKKGFKVIKHGSGGNLKAFKGLKHCCKALKKLF